MLVSLKKAVHSFQKHGLAAIPTRYLVVILAAFTNLISYTMRTNLNLTIVAMVKHTANKSEYHTCFQYNESQTSQESQQHGEFEWSESIQGVVLGAYYYGYIVTNVNAGQLADWIGVRWLIGVAVLISGVSALVIPVCAQWSVYAVIVVRILTGLIQGVLTPGFYTIVAHWIPQQERATALALIQVGGNLGAVLTMPLSAYLAQHGFAGGWPSVFYVTGTFGCLCFIPWMYQIYNTPADHPRIIGKELIYIQSNVSVSSSSSKKKLWVPWRSICTSAQVWIVIITKFCNVWGNIFLMSKLPDYLQSILHLSLNANGLVNASIYIAYSASLMVFGYASDLIERKQLLSRTVSRKVFESTALISAAIFMAIIPAVGCNQTIVIVFLILGMISMGLTSGGDVPIVVDIAPDYSGSIYGFTNAFSSLPGFLAPLFVGLVLDKTDRDTMTQWNILFWVASGIYIFGALIFAIFVSAKPEAWGRKPSELQEQNDDKK